MWSIPRTAHCLVPFPAVSSSYQSPTCHQTLMTRKVGWARVGLGASVDESPSLQVKGEGRGEGEGRGGETRWLLFLSPKVGKEHK